MRESIKGRYRSFFLLLLLRVSHFAVSNDFILFSHGIVTQTPSGGKPSKRVIDLEELSVQSSVRFLFHNHLRGNDELLMENGLT